MITHKKEVKHTFTIELTVQEMLALDAIAGYGSKEFLRIFYTHLGSHYLKPYEGGCETLFDKVRKFDARLKV